MRAHIPMVDVAGVGLNAADTIVRVPRFPSPYSKMEMLSNAVHPGGQVASAMVACSRWGLRARYVGKVGDDAAGEMQRRELLHAGVDTHLLVARGTPSQQAIILVDESCGERTILWQRDKRLELLPRELRREWIIRARALHVDGHDTRAAAQAARWARAAGMPVTADVDNLYPGVQALLENVTHLIASEEFPARLTGERNLLRSLPAIACEYEMKVAAATLGSGGVIAWDGGCFHYSPAFRVRVGDTTGAGDIFHGAFVYGLLQDWKLERILDFSNAAAAINCTALGARGGIASLAVIERLRCSGRHHASRYHRDDLERATLSTTRSAGTFRKRRRGRARIC